MDLESVAKELKMLAGREKLTSPELDRAKYLMTQLKEMGVSNPEIAELTGNRWGESTMKGYTKGVRAVDPELWKSTAALFSEMQSKNLTLANVSQAMTISAELEAMGSSLSNVVGLMDEFKEKDITLDEVAEAIKTTTELEAKGTSPGEIAVFIAELEKEKIDVPALVLIIRDWDEAEITPEDAKSALNYKSNLEAAGYDIDTLSDIAEAAGKFGSTEKVLEAIAKYGNLGELDEDIATKRKESDTLAGNIDTASKKLDTAEQKMQQIQNKTAACEKVIATYEKLKAAGFDEKTLGELASAAEKYGTPRKVLTAINRFGDISRVKAVDNELRDKVKRKRQMLKSLDEEFAHLKEPVDMCKILLKRSFGMRALSAVYAASWKYSGPLEVMKAIEAYGSLREIEKKTAQANIALVEIEGKIEVLKETYAKQNARNSTILDQFETLNLKAIEVGRIVGNVEQQLKKDTSARDILNLLQNPVSAGYEQYLPLVLVMVKSISLWATMNKTRFKYASLVDGNLRELAERLGGN